MQVRQQQRITQAGCAAKSLNAQTASICCSVGRRDARSATPGVSRQALRYRCSRCAAGSSVIRLCGLIGELLQCPCIFCTTGPRSAMAWRAASHAGSFQPTITLPSPSSHTRYFERQLDTDRGLALHQQVPASGLPKISSSVGASGMSTLLAPAPWSIRAKILKPGGTQALLHPGHCVQVPNANSGPDHPVAA